MNNILKLNLLLIILSSVQIVFAQDAILIDLGLNDLKFSKNLITKIIITNIKNP